MQQVAAVLSLAVLALAAACDLTTVPEEQKELAGRVCHLEKQVHIVSNILQELLQRVDITLTGEDYEMPQKRKNEFIRFGKRSADGERKSDIMGLGKRKNEFIRFGRSAPDMEDGVVEKRKNEFIRFG